MPQDLFDMRASRPKRPEATLPETTPQAPYNTLPDFTADAPEQNDAPERPEATLPSPMPQAPNNNLPDFTADAPEQNDAPEYDATPERPEATSSTPQAPYNSLPDFTADAPEQNDAPERPEVNLPSPTPQAPYNNLPDFTADPPKQNDAPEYDATPERPEATLPSPTPQAPYHNLPDFRADAAESKDSPAYNHASDYSASPPETISSYDYAPDYAADASDNTDAPEYSDASEYSASAEYTADAPEYNNAPEYIDATPEYNGAPQETTAFSVPYSPSGRPLPSPLPEDLYDLGASHPQYDRPEETVFYNPPAYQPENDNAPAAYSPTGQIYNPNPEDLYDMGASHPQYDRPEEIIPFSPSADARAAYDGAREDTTSAAYSPSGRALYNPNPEDLYDMGASHPQYDRPEETIPFVPSADLQAEYNAALEDTPAAFSPTGQIYNPNPEDLYDMGASHPQYDRPEEITHFEATAAAQPHYHDEEFEPHFIPLSPTGRPLPGPLPQDLLDMGASHPQYDRPPKLVPFVPSPREREAAAAVASRLKPYEAHISRSEQETIAKNKAVRKTLVPYVPPPGMQPVETTASITSQFELEALAKNQKRRQHLTPYVRPPAPPVAPPTPSPPRAAWAVRPKATIANDYEIALDRQNNRHYQKRSSPAQGVQAPPTTSQFEQDAIAKNKAVRQRLVPYVRPPVVATDEDDTDDAPPLGYVGKPAASGEAAPWGLPPPVTSVTPGTSQFEQEQIAKTNQSRERLVPYVPPPAFSEPDEDESAEPVGYLGTPKSTKESSARDVYAAATYDTPSTSRFEQEQIAKANEARQRLKPYAPPPAWQSSVPKAKASSPVQLGYLGKAESKRASTRSPVSSPTSKFEHEMIAKNNERRERLKPYVPPSAPASVEEDTDARMVGYIGSYVPPTESERRTAPPVTQSYEDDDEDDSPPIGYVGSYVPPTESERRTAPPVTQSYEEDDDEDDSPPIGYVGSYVPPPGA
jgi:hypothetical protein